MKFPLYHRFIIIISIAIIINIVLSIWISPLPITGSIPRESFTEDDSLPSNKCVFRTYPPNRYYYPDGLINYNELPDFLTFGCNTTDAFSGYGFDQDGHCHGSSYDNTYYWVSNVCVHIICSHMCSHMCSYHVHVFISCVHIICSYIMCLFVIGIHIS